MINHRNRLIYLGLLIVVVVIGLGSRSWAVGFLPAFVTTYAGDTLWAFALFLFLGVLFPRMPTVHLALLTLTISFGVEVSQFYQADWINAVRGTRVGGLILGYGFKWTDLACYTAGCSIGGAGEVFFTTDKH